MCGICKQCHYCGKKANRFGHIHPKSYYTQVYARHLIYQAVVRVDEEQTSDSIIEQQLDRTLEWWLEKPRRYYRPCAEKRKR